LSLFLWAPAALRAAPIRFNLRANIVDYNKLYHAGFLASILGASCLCGGAGFGVGFVWGMFLFMQVRFVVKYNVIPTGFFNRPSAPFYNNFIPNGIIDPLKLHISCYNNATAIGL
jgi:hypothetical protein